MGSDGGEASRFIVLGCSSGCEGVPVAAMVRAGMGVAVMPLLCTEPEDPRTELHPLDPPIPGRHVSIAWRSGRTLSPAAGAFIEMATAVCGELSEPDERFDLAAATVSV